MSGYMDEAKGAIFRNNNQARRQPANQLARGRRYFVWGRKGGSRGKSHAKKKHIFGEKTFKRRHYSANPIRRIKCVPYTTDF